MKGRQVNLMALRSKAEAAITKAQSSAGQDGREGDLSLGKLLEELRIYQTELEIQIRNWLRHRANCPERWRSTGYCSATCLCLRSSWMREVLWLKPITRLNCSLA